MLIDFHTHKTYSDGTLFVRSFCADKQPPVNDYYFSIGIHPWQVHECDLNKALVKIKDLCLHKNCIAVGEIGLDKLKPAYELQLQVFERQIKLALELNKPIIIHSIRAFDDILRLRKKYPAGQWVIHGFNGNYALADQLISKNIYLSIGAHLLNPSTKIAKTFPGLPADKLFLETDTAKIHISKLYEHAATFFDDLERQIIKNFSTFAPA